MNEIDKRDMIQDKLENAIDNRRDSNYRDISLIVIHPMTWRNLLKELTLKDDVSINKYNTNLAYKGIKVVHSEDVLENEFIIS